ncbi:TIGR01906 family membrane protein [Fructilactobacillus florum]|nr:TIGR01906 family membrane protein [Fructilactobacillus florum]
MRLKASMTGQFSYSSMVKLLFYVSFTITMATFVVVNASWLYWLNLSWAHLATRFETSNTVLMHNFYQMIKYLQLPWETTLYLEGYRLSARAAQHFADVRRLILINNTLLMLLWIVGLRGYFKQIYHQLWQMTRGLRNFLVGLGILLLLVMLDFNDVFIIFHELLFQNRDWIFDPRQDPVINVLPDQYFFSCFLVWLGIVILGLVTGWYLGERQLKKFK